MHATADTMDFKFLLSLGAARDAGREAADSVGRMKSAPSILGLCVAMGGPILLAGPAGKALGDPHRLSTNLLGQILLWALVATILALVIFWERRPLGSIGLRPLGWHSVVWGLALAGALILLMPIWAGALSRIGLPPSYEGGFAKLAGLPPWFLVFASLTAGVAEETLYRGYALERLTSLTGSYWWGGLISLAVLTLAHLPGWGWGPIPIFFISGGLVTLFYVWRQDLLACIIAHAVTDTVGLISGISASSAS
jgi:membrane protease YdiL (CAAX protease family)